MRKAAIIFACLGILFWIWVAFRLTHIIDMYIIHSDANAPSFKPGKIIFASKLKEPGYSEFVCFKKQEKKEVWIFRCIGKAGDIIEIKNAAVYLNNKLLTEPYVWNEYYISKQQLAAIRGYVDNNKNVLNSINDSLYSITFSIAELKTYHLNLKPFILDKGKVNPEMYPAFVKLNYNEDNLGPVKIPEHCYFLLGDNRHDALDSRYIGFIKREEIISTVIK